MRIKFLSFFVPLFFFFSQSILADTFIVTSNADSGPGTLREAITLANGNGITTIDHIHFNISDISLAGRKIILLSELPPLSSSLIIDGSTQPGSKFGISDTKIELYVFYSSTLTQRLLKIIACSNVSIYGLKINNKIVRPSWYEDTYCIVIEKSTNVEIGNIGKGNVIINWTHAIHAFSGPGFTSKDINIYSNFLGLNEDGITPEYNNRLINVVRIENLNVGNLDPRQGNVMACSNNRVEISGTKGNILVANNKIGTDHSGKVALSLPYGESSHFFDNIMIGNSMWHNEIEYITDIKIINNLSSGICRSGVYLLGYGKKFYIQGNKFGTDITGTVNLSEYMDYGIRIENCNNGIIGVENNEAAEKNIIAFAKRGSGSETYLAGTGVAVINCEYGITISRNSIFCDQKWGIGVGSGGAYNTPVVTINKINATSIRGKAPPNSKIELFRDDSCINCEGKLFFDETFADDNGDWEKTNINTQNVVVTATDTHKMTSEFSSAKYELTNFLIKDATCNQKNGSISEVEIVSGTWWHWENENGTVVGTDTILTNVGPGIYRLVIGIGSNTCDIKTNYYEVKNIELPVSLAPSITSSSCGLANGSIFTDFDTYNITGKWMNSLNDSAGTGTTLNNVLPGTYFLNLFISFDTSCNRKYGPFNVINQSGPLLNTNNLKIIASICSNSNGSITGITATNHTGTEYIEWRDSLNNIVSNSLNLLNQPAGKYLLKFKDQGGCDTIITPYYIIPDEGSLTIDTNHKLIVPAGCTIKKGSITNIHISGADNMQWKNLTTNTNAGNSIDITVLSAGDYQLIASNASGCTINSPVITVPQAQFASIIPQHATINDGNCGENNGSIKLEGFSNEAALLSFLWINIGTNQVAGTELTLAGLGAGTYEFVATDTNGCQQTIFTQPIIVNPKPAFNTSAALLTDDQCSLQKGNITGIKLNGLQGPTAYTWTNANNLVVGNSPDLSNIGTGDYRLTVKDQGICVIESGLFIIKNNDNTGIAPFYDEMMIQRNTAANLIVKNFRDGTYILYSDAAGTQILQQNTTGIFTTAILNDDKDFYVQHIAGSCRSPLVRIKATVVDKSMFTIPTAFTPNQDGLNDKLSLKVIGYIEVEYFRIYNRNGELVFSTNTINNGWDGYLKGSKQPAGAYVWMAKGRDITDQIITDKGNFVLIR